MCKPLGVAILARRTKSSLQGCLILNKKGHLLRKVRRSLEPQGKIVSSIIKIVELANIANNLSAYNDLSARRGITKLVVTILRLDAVALM